MKKILIFILCLTLPTAQCLAIGWGSKASKAAGNLIQKANEAGNNDTVQEASGRVGEAVGNAGSGQYNSSWQHTDSAGQLTPKAQNMADTGIKVAMTGKAVEYTAKAAPHVAWASTSAGYVSAGDYEGATLEAVNGGTRTVVVGYMGKTAGTAVGVWVTGKIGLLYGSWGGPLGALAGFVIGCGAAYLGGEVWDKGIGKGKDALGQKISDWKAEAQYGGTGGRGPDRANARNNSRNAASTVRQTTRTTSRPSRSGCDGRGSCGRR